MNAIYMILSGRSYKAAEKGVGFNDLLWRTVFLGHIRWTNVSHQEIRTPLWSAAAWLGLAKFYQTKGANARTLLLYSTYSFPKRSAKALSSTAIGAEKREAGG